jgi:hypothetical protein
VFPVRYGRNVYVSYLEKKSVFDVATRVDPSSIASTSALRIVRGDEKGTKFLEYINTGVWPSMLRESRI